MSIFLATHADREFGSNPGHTPKGFERLREIALMVPDDISLFVIGTGKRFREIYETMTAERGNLSSLPQKSSPFCGSADGMEADYNIILVDGTLVNLKKDYISLSATCFDAWAFINLLPPRSLLCAGGELLIALGLNTIREQGQLYELDPMAKTGRKIS